HPLGSVADACGVVQVELVSLGRRDGLQCREVGTSLAHLASQTRGAARPEPAVDFFAEGRNLVGEVGSLFRRKRLVVPQRRVQLAPTPPVLFGFAPPTRLAPRFPSRWGVAVWGPGGEVSARPATAGLRRTVGQCGDESVRLLGLILRDDGPGLRDMSVARR